MTRRIGVGDDLEAEISIIEAKRKASVEQVRSWIALTVLIVGVIALVVAMVVSLSDSDFGALQIVWNVIGPLCGAIIGHYFHAAKEQGDGTGRQI